jgi:electron transfer flavoprotein beta subunit
MNILVCICHVPDTTTKIKFSTDNKELDTQGVQFVIGPYDDFALARAVELKEQTGANVTALNIGTIETEPTIRKALAIGADDAIRVDAHPSDSFFVASQIHKIAKDRAFDLILMGRESSDYNTGAVHSMVAEMLGWPGLSPVMKLELDGTKVLAHREIEGGHEEIESDLPLVAGCQEPIAEWKIPNMRGIMSARTKPLEVVEPVEVSSKINSDSYVLPPERSECKIVDSENVGQLVELLKTEAKVI